MVEEQATETVEVRPGSTYAFYPDGLCDERYGELFLVRRTDQGTYWADVYNTIGLNRCPQEAWDALDVDAIAAEHGVLLALRNGPRHWLLDEIVSLAPPPTRSFARFGDIDMTLVASLDLGTELPAGEKYVLRSIGRQTIFRFEAGREVHQLRDPDGWTYVMQAYCLAVDPTLTIDALAGVGERLDLPEGWTFSTRVLDERLDMLSTDGIATVVQDDLENTYQRLDPAP